MEETNWEERYRSGDIPWEKGEPSPGLVDFLAQEPNLPGGAVAVPGCGTGHDVRAWARAGYETVGCDLAPSAIRLSRARTEAAGLNAEFIQRDFLNDEPPRAFNWLFEHTLYCAIQPGQRSAYAEAVARWLEPGGYFLAVHYLIPDEEGPPFGTTREEVLARFNANFELLREWVPRSYPNRTGLERMFWWRLKCGKH